MANPPSRLAFNCYKQALVALNVMYLVVGLVLITVPLYTKVVAIFTSWSIIGGVITCGVFILLLALAGLFGTCRHHQIILFFYMIILVIIFIILFSISIGALSISKSQECKILEDGWSHLSMTTKSEIQRNGQCCGFENKTQTTGPFGHPPCNDISGCKNSTSSPDCKTCLGFIRSKGLDQLKKSVGGVGLFFSFTLFVGVYLAFKFRHLKDPRANPGAFL
ncbi:tetraspanin-31-like [Actinia tenebrosa]|uniref:Tetraspanin-31-like n=1 Tax=Actinia tenebrosa TaxID=6105 RepID=A0A6P8IA60_ACTTE|nr:tetraspanin-31-like [Actinia tenebrosa]